MAGMRLFVGGNGPGFLIHYRLDGIAALAAGEGDAEDFEHVSRLFRTCFDGSADAAVVNPVAEANHHESNSLSLPDVAYPSIAVNY
jgi:hypothetical protein